RSRPRQAALRGRHGAGSTIEPDHRKVAIADWSRLGSVSARTSLHARAPPEMAHEAASRWPDQRRLTPVTCSPPLFQWQVHVRDHLLLPDVRTDIDVMEEHREVARHLAAPSQPFPVKIRGGLVVMTRTDVTRPRT